MPGRASPRWGENVARRSAAVFRVRKEDKKTAAERRATLEALMRVVEPLTKVTELVAPELYRFQPWVQYSGVIGNPRKWKKILYPLAYRLAGFRQVKLKVGIEGQDDVKRTKKIRRWLGSKMDLRIDA